MKPILILYFTKDGHTKKIATVIKQNIESKKYLVDLLEISMISSDFNFEKYESIILGMPVRYGNINKKVYDFISNNYSKLINKKLYLYMVCLSARKPEKRKIENSKYYLKFIQKSKLGFVQAEIFAGVLCYPKYTFFDRMMIRFIMKLTGGETDTTIPYLCYTDWEQVKIFSDEILS